MPTALSKHQRVLVVGWGFIGAAVGTRLNDEGLSVIGLTSTPSARVAVATSRGIDVVVGRAEDPGVLDRLLDSVDHVVYAAGGLLPPDAANDPSADAMRTILPLITTLEALRTRRGLRITLVSSGGAVYGNPSRLPVREDDPTKPISAYGASRLAAESYAQMYAANHGVPVCIARCANVYGPGQPHDRSQGAVAVFLHRILSGQRVTVFGDTVRDYVYIDDVARALAHLVTSPPSLDVVNIGSGVGHTTMELLNAISQTVELPLLVDTQPARAHDVRAVVLDISRLRDFMDFAPTNLDAGLLLLRESVSGLSAAVETNV